MVIVWTSWATLAINQPRLEFEVEHMPSASQIRESILSGKGLRVLKIGLTDKAMLPVDHTGCKSLLMRHIEARHVMKIEDLIWSDSKDNLAVKLEVPVRTISRWRVKFPEGKNK